MEYMITPSNWIHTQYISVPCTYVGSYYEIHAEEVHGIFIIVIEECFMLRYVGVAIVGSKRV